MAVSFEPNEPMGNLLGQLSSIGQKGAFQERMKLPKPPASKPLKPFSGLPPRPPAQGPTLPVTGGTTPVGGDLDILMRAIRGQESGGQADPYKAVNSDSGALGAYQILLSNLTANNGSDWDRQALGRDVTRDEFLNNRAIQDQIAAYKLGEYLKSRGMAGAAATWYGGDWGYKNMHNQSPQNGYPSMYEYVQAILRRAGMK